MSLSRLLLALAALAACYWMITKSGLLGPAQGGASPQAPVNRARAAARSENARTEQAEGASRELDAPPSGGSVTENMTTEQVRSLLGPPDAVETETTDSGAAREKWTYRQAGKTVVFENGIVVRVE
jgi:hypothetical protein